MKLIALCVLVLPLVVLTRTAVSVALPSVRHSVLNPRSQGFTEIFYAFASAANGNGSAFAGLNANTNWYNSVLGLVMLAGGYLPIVIVLALARSLSRGRIHSPSRATLPTSGPTFTAFLLGVVIIVGGLTYLPGLVLNPFGRAFRWLRSEWN